jgi:pyruvate/2-oxoglutarate dehydrogenase complex dihydrolipoamide acyltransferase (E2) component
MTAAAAVPTVTVVEECDFSALAAASTPYARAAAIMGATTAALGTHPALNATLVDDELLEYERCDVGYAVQGGSGLVVPVLRDAAACSAHQLAVEIERLVRSARAGTLTPADLRGGTFTITDARRLGGVLATPLFCSRSSGASNPQRRIRGSRGPAARRRSPPAARAAPGPPYAIGPHGARRALKPDDHGPSGLIGGQPYVMPDMA